jgi:hypothetical protein
MASCGGRKTTHRRAPPSDRRRPRAFRRRRRRDTAHDRQADHVDATGLSVGRVTGEIPTESLSVAGELLGLALAAAARADGGTSSAKLDGKRRQYPNQGVRWTPDEEARLTARLAEGAEIADLRREFGRSANSIRARLVQLGHLSAVEWPAGLSARRAA